MRLDDEEQPIMITKASCESHAISHVMPWRLSGRELLLSLQLVVTEAGIPAYDKFAWDDARLRMYAMRTDFRA